VYFAAAAAPDLRALTLSAESVAAVSEDLQALAVYPDHAVANATVTVQATKPDGSQVMLIRFRPQPDWARRYWFDRPIALPRGTKIEVTAASDDLLPPGATPVKASGAPAASLTLNVIGDR
jgi:hypothetical protein